MYFQIVPLFKCMKTNDVVTLNKMAQVNKNILYESWWHIGLKDNGGVKSTETTFDWNGTG